MFAEGRVGKVSTSLATAAGVTADGRVRYGTAIELELADDRARNNEDEACLSLVTVVVGVVFRDERTDDKELVCSITVAGVVVTE